MWMIFSMEQLLNYGDDKIRLPIFEVFSTCNSCKMGYVLLVFMVDHITTYFYKVGSKTYKFEAYHSISPIIFKIIHSELSLIVGIN